MQAAVTRLSARQNWPAPHDRNDRAVQRELPVGSELLIAVSLGAAGWWAIFKFAYWAVAALT